MPFANDDPQRRPFATGLFASEPMPVAETIQFMPSTAPYRRIKTMRDANDASPDFTPAQLLGAETPGEFLALFDEDYTPVEPFNEFMLHHCYQPARFQNWQKTQAAYADDLAIFLAYLHRKGVNWRSVGRPEIKDYVRELTARTVSTKTRREFSPATVRRRVGTVLTFFDWAVDEKKLIPVENCFGYANRRVLYQDRTRFASHFAGKMMKLVASSGFNKFLPAQPDPADQVRPIPADQIPALLDALGPRFVCDADQRPRRNRLIAEAALLTGMRISEVCSLTLNDIQELSEKITDDDLDAMFAIRVYRTKGRHHRDILFSGRVIKRLDEYALGERHDVIEAALDQGKFGGRNGKQRLPHALFLNGEGANLRDLGEPVSQDTAYRAFRRAVIQVGLTTTVQRYDVDPDTGRPLRENGAPITTSYENFPRHSFHDLRHTYAVNFYAAAIRAGRPDAVKKLQALLGHRHLETTMKIYLRHVEAGEAVIADLHDALFKRLLDGTY